MHANYLDTLDWGILIAYFLILIGIYNPQIEMFAHFKTKSSFHKTKRII